MPKPAENITEDAEARAVRRAAGPPGARPRGLRRRRWAIRLTGLAVLLVGVSVLLLPTLASTAWGNRLLLEQINGRIPGRVQAARVTLSWFGEQRLENARLFDPAGRTVARVEAVHLPDVGLLGLLLGSPEIGAVRLLEPRLDLVVLADGSTNLDAALGRETPAGRVQRGGGRDAASLRGAGERTLRESGRASGRAWSDQRWSLPPDLSLQLSCRRLRITTTAPDLPQVRLAAPIAALHVNTPGSLGVSLDATVRRGEAVGQVKLAGTVKGLFDKRGELTLGEANFALTGSIAQAPLAAVDRLLGTDGRFEALLGPRIDAQLKLHGPLARLDGLFTASSEHLHVRQRIVSDGRGVRANGDSMSTLEVTPRAWALVAGPDAPRLIEPVELSLRIADFDAPRRDMRIDLDGVRLHGALEMGPLRLEVPQRGELRFERTTLAVRSDSLAERIAFELTSAIDAYDRPGRFEARFELLDAWTSRRSQPMRISATLARLPMPVVDALLGQGRRLTATLGPVVTARLDAVASADGGFDLTATFDGPAARDSAASAAGDPPTRLTGVLTGSYSRDGLITLHTPERMRLSLTPEAFERWLDPIARRAGASQRDAGLSIDQPMPIEASIDLSLAFFENTPGLRFDPDRTSLLVDLELPATRLHDEWYDRQFGIRNGQIHVDASDPRGAVTVSMAFETDPTIAPPGSAAQAPGLDPERSTGGFTSTAIITGMMLDDGYLQLEEAQIDADINFERMPTIVFDALTRQGGYAVAAFGNEMTANLRLIDYSLARGGRLQFDLNSANGSLGSLNGIIDGAGMLALTAPTTFYLNATPQLSNRILRIVNPVVLPAVVSARVPIVITIDDDGFTVPLNDFTWELVNADAQVMMGQVTISPEVAPLSRIIPRLEQLGLIPSAQRYEAMVAPIVLTIRQGVLSYEQLPIALGDVTLDFSGKINLPRQSVDMILTLGGRAMDDSPLLRELGDVRINITGTVDQPVVDTDALMRALTGSLLPAKVGDALRRLFERAEE